MTLQKRVDSFWRRFLFHSGLPSTVHWKDCFHFLCLSAEAEDALGLVLAGLKTATFTSLNAFRHYALRPPLRGDLSIVTTFDGAPRCVIQTVAVIVLPFRDVNAAQALAEGEDSTLEGWRIRQRKLLMAEGQELGYTFAPNLSLVYESFRVVYADDEA